MNLKKWGDMGRYGGRKGKEKHCNYIIISQIKLKRTKEMKSAVVSLLVCVQSLGFSASFETSVIQSIHHIQLSKALSLSTRDGESLSSLPSSSAFSLSSSSSASFLLSSSSSSSPSLSTSPSSPSLTHPSPPLSSSKLHFHSRRLGIFIPLYLKRPLVSSCSRVNTCEQLSWL